MHQTAVVIEYRDTGWVALLSGEVHTRKIHRSIRVSDELAWMFPFCSANPTVSCASVSIPNVLAARYASAELVAIWSPEARVIAERQLWLAVLRAQAELSVPMPVKAIAEIGRAHV